MFTCKDARKKHEQGVIGAAHACARTLQTHPRGGGLPDPAKLEGVAPDEEAVALPLHRRGRVRRRQRAKGRRGRRGAVDKRLKGGGVCDGLVGARIFKVRRVAAGARGRGGPRVGRVEPVLHPKLAGEERAVPARAALDARHLGHEARGGGAVHVGAKQVQRVGVAHEAVVQHIRADVGRAGAHRVVRVQRVDDGRKRADKRPHVSPAHGGGAAVREGGAAGGQPGRHTQRDLVADGPSTATEGASARGGATACARRCMRDASRTT
jgi:hypothetical protein